LPAHRGYQQLSIILEKRANFREVIVLCARAQKEGWSGDWEQRIERCRKKMAKGEHEKADTHSGVTKTL
jgi:hypothetical protein